MPTAVLDLELTALPAQLDELDGYDAVLALIRMRGRPVGWQRFVLQDGRIETWGRHLREHLIDAVGWPAWQAWINAEFDLDAVAARDTLPRLTVAVCTRNRPAELRRCLETLLRMPDDGQEVLVVDHAPQDDSTRQLVADFSTVRYLREERKGLASARNAALRAAQGDIIAFTDDDACVDPGWLRALVRGFSDPLVLCVTGQALPCELETPAQEWFEQYSGFSRGFQRRVFDGLSHYPHAANAPGAGVNMALRRSIAHLIGPFDEAFGPGMPTRSGADIEMFARILLAGYRIAYVPDALVWQHLPADWKQLQRWMHDYSLGASARWTRELLLRGEVGGVVLAVDWVRNGIIPQLRATWRREPGSVPPALPLGMLRGLVVGPWAYLQARQQCRRQAANFAACAWQ